MINNQLIIIECVQATQVLGAYLLKDATHEFVHCMKANGDVTPNRSKQCAGALREWCQACPQLTRTDGEHEADTGSGSGAGAGPSGAVVPTSPPLPKPGPSSVCLSLSGNGANPSGVGTGSSGVRTGPSGAATSNTPVSVAADSGIGVGSVPRTGPGEQRAPADASVPSPFDP